MARSITIDILAPVPSKKNGRILTNGISLPSKAYMTWHKEMMLRIKGACEVFPLYRISVEFCMGDLVHRDQDNSVTSILDLLQDAGITLNDSWRYAPSGAWYTIYKKGVWHCKVTLTEQEQYFDGGFTRFRDTQ